jgi:hypothetical protein
LQNFVDPISSVYLSCALLKLMVQIAVVLMMAGFISGKKNILSKEFLFTAVIIAPLFQVYGYWSRMGIVDKSIAYTFFYGLPLVLLMLFFIPFFRMIYENRNVKFGQFVSLLPLMIILPLSGPLIPAVIVIVSSLIFFNYLVRGKIEKSSFRKRIYGIVHNTPRQLFLLLPAGLWSLYALYLGAYDSNYLTEAIPVFERYSRLPMGLYSQVFYSLGFPLLLIMIGANMWIIKKRYHDAAGKKIMDALKWIGIFSLIYILLLPLGGYRPYRPNTIRYDTFMPVTVALIYLFGASSWLLISRLKGKIQVRYIIAVILVLSIYTLADTGGLTKNADERHALEILANSPEAIVSLPDNFTIMSWGKTYDYKQSKHKAELLHYWQVTKTKKLFYQEQKVTD